MKISESITQKRRKPEGYYKVTHTWGLWKHVTRPVQFTLVLNDFGVKYTNESNFEHLVYSFKNYFK